MENWTCALLSLSNIGSYPGTSQRAQAQYLLGLWEGEILFKNETVHDDREDILLQKAASTCGLDLTMSDIWYLSEHI